MRKPRETAKPRAGVAIVMVIVLLLVVGLIIVGMVVSGGRDQALTVRRVETVQSFYAAEGGINMAVREMMLGMDEDGDGGIGTISDDASDATDPAVGAAQVVVTKSLSGMVTTLDSQGRSGASRREAEAELD